jgi:hypothetical protein
MTLLALGSGWISDGQSGFGSFGGGRLRTHTDVGESERPPRAASVMLLRA